MANSNNERKKSKSILKSLPDHPALGGYNLHTKRASFKDDGIAVQQLAERFGKECCADKAEPVEEDPYDNLTEEEIQEKKRHFDEKRKAVEHEGINLKALLKADESELESEDLPIDKFVDPEAIKSGHTFIPAFTGEEVN